MKEMIQRGITEVIYGTVPKGWQDFYSDKDKKTLATNIETVKKLATTNRISLKRADFTPVIKVSEKEKSEIETLYKEACKDPSDDPEKSWKKHIQLNLSLGISGKNQNVKEHLESVGSTAGIVRNMKVYNDSMGGKKLDFSEN
eukprot:TRINITY_DN650_c0_g1_i3.p1 TRINITY_DN650_c0_g1~~TRINITY_DN650_c0_g1_i3.p1  ORF type:complete len:143 (+),score=13.73 TRINITY_DN650_c0_g1_i3:569-997(+)